MTVETRRPSTLARLSRLLCVLLLAAGATGCAKLFYNRLDSLAAWYVGNLVSLDDHQQSTLRAWLAQTLEWHREKELGRYATFLRELSAEVAQPSGRGAYQRALDRVEGFAQDFTAQTAPQAARLLMELSPAQVEEFLANLEEKSNERAAGEPRRAPRRHLAGEAGQGHAAAGEALDRRDHGRAESAGARDGAAHSADDRRLARESAAVARCAWQKLLAIATTPRSVSSSCCASPTRSGPRSTRRKKRATASRCCPCSTALDASLTPAQRGRMQRELTTLAERLEALTEE